MGGKPQDRDVRYKPERGGHNSKESCRSDIISYVPAHMHDGIRTPTLIYKKSTYTALYCSIPLYTALGITTLKAYRAFPRIWLSHSR